MTKSPRMGWGKRLVFLAFTIVMMAVLVEIGFRLLVTTGAVQADIWPLADVDVENTIHRYSEDPELLYEGRPNAATVENGIEIRMNPAGFRTAEFTKERTPGVRRVVVLGDSVAFAAEVAEDARFTELLQRRLEEATRSRWEVLNLGVTGYNSLQELRLLDSRALALDPDLILLAYVQNDVMPTDGLGALCRAAHPTMPGRRLHSHVLVFAQNWRERRTAWRRRSFDGPARLFERLSEVSRSGGAEVLVVLLPQMLEGREKWNRPEEYDRARQLAEDRGLAVLDLRAAWDEERTAPPVDLYVDRTHLSVAGHADLAKRLAPLVPALLAGE